MRIRIKRLGTKRQRMEDTQDTKYKNQDEDGMAQFGKMPIRGIGSANVNMFHLEFRHLLSGLRKNPYKDTKTIKKAPR
jgi:hypothetical protein